MTAAPGTDQRGIAGTVTGLLDVEVTVPGVPGAADFYDLAGLALRDNPRRAHLIVSKILGKHIPADPRTVLAGGHALGDAVAALLPAPLDATGLVIGYCETATGLGHAVAARLGGTYLHTTRRLNPQVPVAAQFDEEHSHAVAHLLQPAGDVSLTGTGPLVLVDDELTSGKTALNTIAALHEQFPRPLYVIAALLDARTPAGRVAFEARAADLGVNVLVASVLSAHLTLPENVLDRAQAARDALPAPAPAPAASTAERAEVRTHADLWLDPVPVTARHGMIAFDTGALHVAASYTALRLAEHLTGTGSVLVVGTEELLYAPTFIAAELAEALPEAVVHTQSTTRSPVHAADDPAYAVRRTVTFPAPDDPTRVSRLHNLADPSAVPPADSAWSDLRYDDIVVVVDAPEADCAGLVEVLRSHAARAVHLVLLPVPPTVPVAT